MQERVYQRGRRKCASGRKQQRKFRRELLPAPAAYFAEQGYKWRTNADGWITVRCPFHDDNRASLQINLAHGGFWCAACDAKGGDVLAFHMQRQGLPFKQAVTDLGAWERSW